MDSRRKKVAIAIPRHSKNLSRSEETSLDYLEKHLGCYDRFFVTPQDLQFSRIGYRHKKFPSDYFRNNKTYHALLLSKKFYEAFRDYEYVLIYQLDCLVFKDELLQWCKKGYDYIGAPWFKRVPSTRMWWSHKDCVGNGGFSLRKVAACLRLIRKKDGWKIRWFSFEYFMREVLDDFMKIRCMPFPIFCSKSTLRVMAFIRNFFKNKKAGTARRRVREEEPEDVLFLKLAQYYDDDFKIAPVEEALKFAWETEPRYCYEKNKRQLPFGCHAWERHDRKFWETFLLPSQIAPSEPHLDLPCSI